MENIIMRLKEQGCRLTPQRRAVIKQVYESTEPLTVTSIWHSVREAYPNISLDTVYRNVSVLVELGVLIPIKSTGKEGIRYELAATDHHHHHVVCVKCGQAVCIDFCPVNQHLLELLHGHGYELVRHTVELFGICADCRLAVKE